MKKPGLLVTILLVSVLVLVPTQSVKAEHWVEVIRYEGRQAAFVTEPFTCNYSEWRIRYESYVGTHFPMIIPGVYLLNVTTYPQGEATNYTDRIRVDPTQGEYFYHLIHDSPGTFYMKISTGFSDNYSVIIEQNIDSVFATPSSVAFPTPTTSNHENDSAMGRVPLELIFTVAAIAAIVIIALAISAIKKKNVFFANPLRKLKQEQSDTCAL